MKLAILAARDGRAQQRMIDATTELAKNNGLDVPKLRIQARDKPVRDMLQRETIADFLDNLLSAEKSRKPAVKQKRQRR